jgi:hypothetical protein
MAKDIVLKVTQKECQELQKALYYYYDHLLQFRDAISQKSYRKFDGTIPSKKEIIEIFVKVKDLKKLRKKIEQQK